MRRVFAVLLLLLGVPLLLAGAAVAALVGPRGTVSSGMHHLSTRGSAIVTASSLFRYAGPTLHVTARTVSGQGDVFIGVGHQADVQGYLAGSSYTTVTGFRPPWDVSRDESSANAPQPVPEPAGLPLWVASVHGPGQRELNWPVTNGKWNVLLTTTRPATGLSVDASIGVSVRYLFEALLAAAVAGLVLCVAAVLMLRRKRPPAAAALAAGGAVPVAADGPVPVAAGAEQPPWGPAPPPPSAAEPGEVAPEPAAPEPGALFRPSAEPRQAPAVPAQSPVRAGPPLPAEPPVPAEPPIPAGPPVPAPHGAPDWPELPALTEPAVAYPASHAPRNGSGPVAPQVSAQMGPAVSPEVTAEAGAEMSPEMTAEAGDAGFRSASGWPGRSAPLDPGDEPDGAERPVHRPDAAPNGRPGPDPSPGPQWVPGSGSPPEAGVTWHDGQRPPGGGSRRRPPEAAHGDEWAPPPGQPGTVDPEE